MKVIKEVPTKIFNQALDRWLDRSINFRFINLCSYCEFYVNISLINACKKCVLQINNKCCNGLYDKWHLAYVVGNFKKAKKLADKIVDQCLRIVPPILPGIRRASVLGPLDTGRQVPHNRLKPDVQTLALMARQRDRNAPIDVTGDRSTM